MEQSLLYTALCVEVASIFSWGIDRQRAAGTAAVRVRQLFYKTIDRQSGTGKRNGQDQLVDSVLCCFYDCCKSAVRLAGKGNSVIPVLFPVSL